MKSQQAFSMIEMLMVLSIMAIVAALSLPLLTNLLASKEDDIIQSQLLHTLQFAHQEALVRRVSIAMCKSQNHRTCGGDWMSGQLIFTDENEDGRIHDKAQIIASIQTLLKRGTLYWRAYPRYRDYIQFFPAGFTQSDNGTFWFCRAEKHLPSWAILLNKTAEMHVVLPNQQGNILDANGKPLSCDG